MDVHPEPLGSNLPTDGGYPAGVQGIPGSVLVVGVSSGVSKALLPTIGSYTIPALHSPTKDTLPSLSQSNHPLYG